MKPIRRRRIPTFSTRYMIAVAVIAAVGCESGVETSDGSSALTLSTVDGLKIAATLHKSAIANPPGLILIHMYGSDRSAWGPFAARAQREGYSVISFDMRGHGETEKLNPDSQKYRGFSTDEWKAVLFDIEAAKHTLIYSGVDADRIGVIGASIGANLAAGYGAKSPDVGALVLLSPGKTYKGIRVDQAFAEYGKRPSMLVTGESDRYSSDTCHALHDSASGFCELREFPGTHHGTDILDAIPNATVQILQWCNTVLGAPSPSQG